MSATITGAPAALQAVIEQLREHGGELRLADGKLLRGPITGRTLEDPLDGVQTARITLAFPIES